MPDTYQLTREADEFIEQLLETDKDHEDLRLAGVTIAVLFREGDKPMQHGGWTALAYVKKTSAKERVQGVRDAVIVIDHEPWMELEDKQKLTLLDHELYHLIPIVEAVHIEGEGPDEREVKTFEYDTAGRPKLRMRKHDVQVGWFARMAEKHGTDSMERIGANEIVQKYGQLFFGFGGDEGRPKRRRKASHSPTADAMERLKESIPDGGSITISAGGHSVKLEGAK